MDEVIPTGHIGGWKKNHCGELVSDINTHLEWVYCICILQYFMHVCSYFRIMVKRFNVFGFLVVVNPIILLFNNSVKCF